MGPECTIPRAESLARAASQFREFLGEVTAAGLLDLMRRELGHSGMLDDFQRHGGHFTKAVGPRAILHVISGNTPHAGLQSLLRGLLLNAHNLCKLPSGGLPELNAFRAGLPVALAERVELSETLPDAWMRQADVVIVFGSDATIAEFRHRVRENQKFIAHGHRVSLGIVFDDPECASAILAAADASVFDQRGCQSPHLFYVRRGAREYAARLAAEMENFNRGHPRARLSPADAARIHAVREETRFRAANDPERVALWHSAGSTDWTVIFDAADPLFSPSPGDRVVFVKPLPDNLTAALAPANPHLATIGLWPATLENARLLEPRNLGATRLCPIGKMQAPPLTWHQDGMSNLADLVRWIDFEPGLTEESQNDIPS